MKIKIAYDHIPNLEIEAGAEECARLLMLLARQGQDLTPAVTRAEPPSVQPRSEATTETKPPAEKSAPRTPTAPGNENPTPKVTPQRAGTQRRTYRGQVNRRQLVLDTLATLKRRGIENPRLDDITRCYRELFPEADMNHLGQIVRDLANKTDKVERLQWGVFRLTDAGDRETRPDTAED
ncbi:hypothetical protein SCOR_34985 [Sulfidibacter corallicola]|uniref:Uncharacterized protein n=1 Tax=Sulfidibacter corallicola TaxID=2818388 RepID=A0A8A4TK63_SULCO|nr:hypothetical protein [Sulfidibacter corallicola]QTD49261.1 hypothetical protein J3U87_27055 [Sulfidibacter corallicola]